jgi:hypothetical protein
MKSIPQKHPKILGLSIFGGIFIKKIYFLILLVSLLVISNPKFICAAEKDQWIVRHILLDYQLDKSSKTINAYYIQIQKEKSKDPIIDKSFVKKINLSQDRDVRNTTVEELVNNDQSLYYDVYINDEIFGMIAPVFLDLSQQNISEDEAQIYIDQALKQIKKDFENPPSKEEIDKQVYEKMKKFSPKKEKNGFTITKFIYILLGAFLIWSIMVPLKKMKK